MSAYHSHPGKVGKVQPGWYKAQGNKRVKRNPYAIPTATPIRHHLSDDVSSMNKAAWIKLRARIDSKDFNEAVRMAVASY